MKRKQRLPKGWTRIYCAGPSPRTYFNGRARLFVLWSVNRQCWIVAEEADGLPLNVPGHGTHFNSVRNALHAANYYTKSH